MAQANEYLDNLKQLYTAITAKYGSLVEQLNDIKRKCGLPISESFDNVKYCNNRLPHVVGKQARSTRTSPKNYKQSSNDSLDQGKPLEFLEYTEKSDGELDRIHLEFLGTYLKYNNKIKRFLKQPENSDSNAKSKKVKDSRKKRTRKKNYFSDGGVTMGRSSPEKKKLKEEKRQKWKLQSSKSKENGGKANSHHEIELRRRHKLKSIKVKEMDEVSSTLMDWQAERETFHKNIFSKKEKRSLESRNAQKQCKHDRRVTTTLGIKGTTKSEMSQPELTKSFIKLGKTSRPIAKPCVEVVCAKDGKEIKESKSRILLKSNLTRFQMNSGPKKRSPHTMTTRNLPSFKKSENLAYVNKYANIHPKIFTNLHPSKETCYGKPMKPSITSKSLAAKSESTRKIETSKSNIANQKQSESKYNSLKNRIGAY